MLEELKAFYERNKMEQLFNSTHSFDMWLKACHINFMTSIAMKLAESDDTVNSELLQICCLHHDDAQHVSTRYMANLTTTKLATMRLD